MAKKVIRPSADVRKDMAAVAGKVFSAGHAIGKVVVADGAMHPKLAALKDLAGSFDPLYQELQKLDLELGDALRAENPSVDEAGIERLKVL